MPENNEDDQSEYLTRDEALAAARTQAARDLVIADDAISYVAFVPGFEDFCHCEYRAESPGNWTMQLRLLRDDERRPSEQITDAHIHRVAVSGNQITAIRLYRAKYKVNLSEARSGVERLIERGPMNTGS